MYKALTLSRAEREIRQHKLSRYVSVNTASYWAKSFLQDLRTVCANKPNISKLPKLSFDQVLTTTTTNITTSTTGEELETPNDSFTTFDISPTPSSCFVWGSTWVQLDEE